jgi:hypothetical protein
VAVGVARGTGDATNPEYGQHRRYPKTAVPHALSRLPSAPALDARLENRSSSFAIVPATTGLDANRDNPRWTAVGRARNFAFLLEHVLDNARIPAHAIAQTAGSGSIQWCSCDLWPVLCAARRAAKAAFRTAGGVRDFDWITAAMSVGRAPRMKWAALSRFSGVCSQ